MSTPTVPSTLPVGGNDHQVLTMIGDTPGWSYPETELRLRNAAKAGEHTIEVSTVTAEMIPGAWIHLSVGTPRAETKRILSVDGKMLRFYNPWAGALERRGQALRNSHSKGSVVLSKMYGEANIVHYGAREGITYAEETGRAIQAALDDADSWQGSGHMKVYVPAGQWATNQSLFIETGVQVYGDGCYHSWIVAGLGYVPGGDEDALINGRRSGDDSDFDGGPTTRMYLKDIGIDGGLMKADSGRKDDDGNVIYNGTNGILATLQQPGHWENVTITNCLGWGYNITGQQLVSYNLVVLRCGRPLVYRNMMFHYAWSTNAETTEQRRLSR
jgi:hypothetical protein